MKNLLLLLLVLGLAVFCGCHRSSKYDYVFPNDPKISDAHGWPHDSTVQYFPRQIQLRDSLIRINWDTIGLREYSKILWLAKEPVLFNYNRFNDCYRIAYDPSFGAPLVLTLSKDANQVALQVKKMRRYIDTSFWSNAIPFRPWLKNKPTKLHLVPLVIKYDPPKVVFNKIVSLDVWKTFEDYVNGEKFLEQTPIGEQTINLDGFGSAVLEHHSKNRYWIVERNGEVPGLRYLAIIAGIIIP